MTSPEHIELSNFIKSIHKKLRQEAQILGTEQAWKNHCSDSENLGKYASAMHQLAVNHWDRNHMTDQRILSRIFWIYSACKDYFTYIKKHRDKEMNIIKKCLTSGLSREPVPPKINLEFRTDVKYKLLDVGSCYNPFSKFDMFEVIPIDIAPANKDVLKCDFLNLNISDKTVIEDLTVKQFNKQWFDIIVFSLLLEYFPSPAQRLKCCLNAYELLKPEGILAVVTPDSNHVGSNGKIFKSWQYVLAKHGFIRIKYEKLPYIHCMLFRKACFKIVAQRWAEIHESEDFFQEIFIPQDFTDRVMPKFQNDSVQDEWHEDTFLQDFNSNVSELF